MEKLITVHEGGAVTWKDIISREATKRAISEMQLYGVCRVSHMQAAYVSLLP